MEVCSKKKLFRGFGAYIVVMGIVTAILMIRINQIFGNHRQVQRVISPAILIWIVILIILIRMMFGNLMKVWVHRCRIEISINLRKIKI